MTRKKLDEETERRRKAEEEAACAKRDLDVVNVDLKEARSDLRRVQQELSSAGERVGPGLQWAAPPMRCVTRPLVLCDTPTRVVCSCCWSSAVCVS